MWKVIEGWERYEVSNKGQIRNSETKKILRTRPDKDGYLIITFSINKVRSTQKVHRLVAKAFIPNIESLPQINHKDGNHANNDVRNLEWCTSSQNHLHAYRILGRKVNKEGLKPSEKKKVLCVETGEIFDSATSASKKVNGHQGPLSSVCRKERKTYKGMHWEYVD